jgi:flagellar biosynthesis/type III secretory pathway chaperone
MPPTSMTDMERLAARIEKIDQQIRQLINVSNGHITEQIRELTDVLLKLHEEYDRYRFIPHAIHKIIHSEHFK